VTPNVRDGGFQAVVGPQHDPLRGDSLSHGDTIGFGLRIGNLTERVGLVAIQGGLLGGKEVNEDIVCGGHDRGIDRCLLGASTLTANGW